MATVWSHNKSQLWVSHVRAALERERERESVCVLYQGRKAGRHIINPTHFGFTHDVRRRASTALSKLPVIREQKIALSSLFALGSG